MKKLTLRMDGRTPNEEVLVHMILIFLASKRLDNPMDGWVDPHLVSREIMFPTPWGHSLFLQGFLDRSTSMPFSFRATAPAIQYLIDHDLLDPDFVNQEAFTQIIELEPKETVLVKTAVEKSPWLKSMEAQAPTIAPSRVGTYDKKDIRVAIRKMVDQVETKRTTLARASWAMWVVEVTEGPIFTLTNNITDQVLEFTDQKLVYGFLYKELGLSS